VEGPGLDQEVLESHLQDTESLDRAGEVSAAVEHLAGLVVELGVALGAGCEEEEEEEDWVEEIFEHVRLPSATPAISKCLSA
jgi:hypothetical protein